MRALAALASSLMFLTLLASPGHAGLRNDVARCSAIADDAARLACFDNLATSAAAEGDAQASAAVEALKDEFRFSRGVMTGPFSFRLSVSGDLSIARPTAAAREVEGVVKRIAKALTDIDDWSIAVTVHGAQIALSRGHPYTGAELLQQARTGMARSGLSESRYTVSRGEDAVPVLWDDGRVRSVNEHIIVEVTGLGEPLTR